MRQVCVAALVAAIALSWSTIGHGQVASWPMFRHDETHTGVSPYIGPSALAILWSYRAGGDVVSSPAQSSDGSVYVGSDDNVLYAYSAAGAIEWSYRTADIISSSPALNAAEEVYVGSKDNQFYAFNSIGGLKWSYAHPGGAAVDEWESSPVISATGGVYLQARRSLVVFDSIGSLVWSFSTGTASAAHSSSPALGSDGQIYWGTGSFGVVYAVKSNWAFGWSYKTAGTVESSPAIGSAADV